MPWLPSTCSSLAMTTSMGTAGRPCAGGSSPTCTCRPRGRRHLTEFSHVTAAPSASSETCAPPPVDIRQRPPVGESGLGLVRADLVLPRGALRAATTGVDEGHGHPVAGPPPAHARPDRGDGAGQFVAGHVRQDDVGVVPLPGVPVAAADAAGSHPDDDAAGRGVGDGHVHHTERAAEALEHQCTHPGSLPHRSPGRIVVVA
jgi:hypothetical protein